MQQKPKKNAFLIKFNIIHDKNSSQIGKRKNFSNWLSYYQKYGTNIILNGQGKKKIRNKIKIPVYVQIVLNILVSQTIKSLRTEGRKKIAISEGGRVKSLESADTNHDIIYIIYYCIINIL